MKKKLLLLSALAVVSFVNAQVGINTTNPQGIFHIDGGKDNPVIGAPSIVQQSNDLTVVTASGLGSGSISLGIGTTSPTQRLDIASGSVRVRGLFNGVTGTGSDKLLVTDASGIIKPAGGDLFSIDDSGNRVLDATNGADMNAAADWTNNVFTTLELNEQYDPLNAYDATTGEFTVPRDGLYSMYGVCGFNTPQNAPGVFDGTSGTAFTTLAIDGGRVATSSGVIYRGAKNPSPISSDSNLFFQISNATLWLKAGQKVTLQFMTFGTQNMVQNLSDLRISKQYSRLLINKLL
ncbi:hypothetical protein [Chryseobacterium sp. JUb7]|uniref:hypothetical protein n=1 Tax=Chryseobacterium sp. JUb7 TaxID=2940599 RepID=UPI002167588C|nr:hypothetical protein [Chryseobacterium sp. JUb7]MCS3530591.1 hypothetical protein [Chryseobacterium sp. JUb7]